MVEFSLVFVLFLIMMVGLFELGRLVWVYTTVAHAARQGARYAMVHGENNPVSDDVIIAKVRREAVGLTSSQVSVTPIWEDGGKAVGSFVQIQVRYPVPLIGTALWLGSSDIRVGSESRMTVVY